MVSELLSFTVVVALVTMTPGLDMALVTRATVASGRRAGFATTGGLVTGVFVWGLAAGVGLAATIATSRELYLAVEVGGGLYLTYIGVRYLLAALRGDRPTLAIAEEGPMASAPSAFMTGLVTDILNPKMAVFYVSLLPQFVQPGDAVLPTCLLLASIHACIGLTWFGLYTMVVAHAGLGSNPRTARAIDAGAGAVLVALGTRLVLFR
jgi:threonine/homoserine/homoserine lactone efflux protein